VNQETEQIARTWVAQFDERLGWLDQALFDMTVPEMVAIASSLEERQKKLSNYIAMMKDSVALALITGGNKTAMATALDGAPLQVTASRKPRRTNVDREALFTAVRNRARDNRTVNEDTGEMESLEASVLRHVDRVFRLEPRWSELAKLDIDGDEFCETQWSNNVTIERGTTL
jgi:hypothetical protein